MAKPYTYRLQAKNQQSPVVLIATGDLLLDVDPVYPHNFGGVVFFNDAGGVTPVTPSSGTTTTTIKTSNQPQDFQAITNGTVNADSANQTDWSANTLQVNFSFTSIVGATHARAIVTGNQS